MDRRTHELLTGRGTSDLARPWRVVSPGEVCASVEVRMMATGPAAAAHCSAWLWCSGWTTIAIYLGVHPGYMVALDLLSINCSLVVSIKFMDSSVSTCEQGLDRTQDVDTGSQWERLLQCDPPAEICSSKLIPKEPYEPQGARLEQWNIERPCEA